MATHDASGETPPGRGRSGELTAGDFRGCRTRVIVHHAPLGSGERVLVDAVAVTSVERTLIDLAASADPALAEAAARDALDRGLTTRRRLERAVHGDDIAKTVLGGAMRR